MAGNSDRQELEELRRLDELERKAMGTTAPDIQLQPPTSLLDKALNLTNKDVSQFLGENLTDLDNLLGGPGRAMADYANAPEEKGAGIGGFLRNLPKAILRFPTEQIAGAVEQGPVKTGAGFMKFPFEVGTMAANALGANVPPSTQIGDVPIEQIQAPSGEETRSELYRDPVLPLLAALPFLKLGKGRAMRPVTKIKGKLSDLSQVAKGESTLKAGEPVISRPKIPAPDATISKQINIKIAKRIGLDNKPINDWNIQNIADYKHELWREKARGIENNISETRALIRDTKVPVEGKIAQPKKQVLPAPKKPVLKPPTKAKPKVEKVKLEKKITQKQINDARKHYEMEATGSIARGQNPDLNRSVQSAQIRWYELKDKFKSQSKPTERHAGAELGVLGAPETYKALSATATKTMRNISETTSEMVKKAQEKPEIKRGVKEAKETMIEHDRQIRRSESTHQLLKKTVKDIVKDKDRQMLIIHASEHKLRGGFWNKLTEIEKGVARWAVQEKGKLQRFIKDNEILELMKDPDLNHFFHHWINPKSGKPYAAMYSKFSKGLPQAKQRKIRSYAIGMKATPDLPMGTGGGMKPATTNIGDLIGLEWESAMRAHQTRQMFKSLAEIQGEKGVEITRVPSAQAKPVRFIERWDKLQQQGLADDYMRATDMGVNARQALSRKFRIKGEDGIITSIDMDVGVHKSIASHVRAYIENPTYGTLSQLNFISKSLKLGGNLFHPVMLGWQELANWRIPFKNIPRGLKLRNNLGPEVRLLHQEGLELFKGYEDVGYRNKFFEGVNLGGKIGNVATYPVTKMRDFIFEVVQPGMKTAFAFDKFNKLLPKYLKGTEWTPEMVIKAFESGKPLPKEALKCARDVVKKADGHFSGEHYKRSLLETNRWMVKMYFSPEARKFWQAALLSPTWQREHVLVAKNVAKSFMPNKMIKKYRWLGEEVGPIRRDYQKYALAGVMIVGAVDMYNYMMTEQMDGKGKHLWQNPEGKGFGVRAWWDEPGYTVTDKNGKKRRIKGGKAYIRPLKSLFEVAEWGSKPLRKLSYKVAPWISATSALLFPGKYDKEYKGITDLPEASLQFLLDVGEPITVNQYRDWLAGKKTFKAAAFPFIGMPVSKVKDDNKKKRKVIP